MARKPRPNPGGAGPDATVDPDSEAAAPARRPWGLIAAWAVFALLVAGAAGWLLLAGAPPAVQAPLPALTLNLPPPPAPPPPPPPPQSPPSAEAEPAPPQAAPEPPRPPPLPAPTPRPAPPPVAPAPAAPTPAPAPAAGTPAPVPTTGPTGPLPPVPDPALVEPGPQGPLPIVAPDGRQPWRVYARPFGDRELRPRIAIVIGSLGLSEAATNASIQTLPGEVSLAFMPYARNLQDWIATARAAGHEALLQLPMEPDNYPASDPGPQALLTTLSDAENQARLDWLLSRASGYAGTVSFMGSKFLTSPERMRPMLTSLRNRGLMFVDSRVTARSAGSQVGRDLGMPVAYNDRFIDAEASRTAIDARLEELERAAKQNGAAVGIGFPYPVTIERVTAWAATLPSRGVVLAPVSAVANRQPLK